MNNFSKDSKAWLFSLIKQRSRLLKYGASKVPEANARVAIDFLARHLEAYQYNDVNMAAFIMRNKEHIRSILPGFGSTCYMKRRREFDDILLHAREITTEPLKLKLYV